MDIKWIGSKFYNVGRQGVIPFVIVNHVSQGTLASMDGWFNSDNNPGSSSTFGVGLDGTIHQYVKIEDKAWGQGIPIPEGIPFATAQVVKDMKINPNFYCVSIEREGYYVDNKDGTFTGELGWLDGSAIPIAQYNAILWLHRYIMDYVNTKMGGSMKLNDYSVLGHFQIDPRRKPFCPGVNFPWEELRAELKIAESMTLVEYEFRQMMQDASVDLNANFYKNMHQHVFLYNQYKTDPVKFKWLEPYLTKLHKITEDMGMYFGK